MNHLNVPVLGFAAYSRIGKTTLLAKLIPLLKQQGVSIALIKHAHHQAQCDFGVIMLCPGSLSDCIHGIIHHTAKCRRYLHKCNSTTMD